MTYSPVQRAPVEPNKDPLTMDQDSFHVRSLQEDRSPGLLFVLYTLAS
jgi:hypothetical protein